MSEDRLNEIVGIAEFMRDTSDDDRSEACADLAAAIGSLVADLGAAEARVAALTQENELLRESEAEWQRRGDRAIKAEAKVAALTRVAEAAQELLEVPRTMTREPDGTIVADFRPQQEARKKLAEKLAALDGLVGLHEQEQK